MKISPAAANSLSGKNPGNPNYLMPAIPLEKEKEPDSHRKCDRVEYSLKITPSVTNSLESYKLTVNKFGNGKPEAYLDAIPDLKKILIGQNITTGPSTYAVARTILVGDALRAFNTNAKLVGNETVEAFKSVVRLLTKHVFPVDVLTRQKTWMRRIMRKPLTLNVKNILLVSRR